MTTVSRRTTQGKEQSVLSGIQSELQSMPSMRLGAKTYSPHALAALVQNRIDLANAIVTAKASWDDAVKAYDAASKEVTVVIGDLRNLVIAAFGRDSPKLASFGFAPPKVSTRTSEQRAAAARKGAATRRARATMSRKRKAAIKGTPEAVP